MSRALFGFAPLNLLENTWGKTEGEVQPSNRTSCETLRKMFLFSCFVGGDGAEAATTRASRRSKRVTRGQPATPRKIESDTSHKIWRHPDRYFPYSLV